MNDFVKLEVLLTAPLEMEGTNRLKEQIAELQSYQLPVEMALTNASRELSIAKARQLVPVLKGRTELDRRVELTGNTVDEQHQVDYLNALIKTLDAKLDIGCRLLN